MTGRNPENLDLAGRIDPAAHRQAPRDACSSTWPTSPPSRCSPRSLRDEDKPLDILINNAAQWLPGKLHDNDAYAISQTITGIVTGTLLFTRGLIPLLEKSGAGDIMNIVSISGIANTPLLGASVAYYAAKHGQAGMNDGLRQELKGRPVRVSAIYPSYIKDISPLNEAEWNATPEQHLLGHQPRHRRGRTFRPTRPRHMTLASIVVDPDSGGLY